MKKWCSIVCVCLIVFFGYDLLSNLIDNPFIAPDPFLVIRIMQEQIFELSFYQSLGMTIVRVGLSVLCSLLFGIGCAISTLLFPKWKHVIDIVITLIRSIPNITLLILLLFWFRRENSIFVLLFCVLFPIVYQNYVEEFDAIEKKWRDIFLLYPQPRWYLIKNVYLPKSRSVFASSLISITTLGFKVVVMAEILTQVPIGIGRNMQLAKLDVDLAGLLSWTIWLLIFVGLFVFLLKRGIRLFFNKEERWN